MGNNWMVGISKGGGGAKMSRIANFIALSFAALSNEQ